MRLLNKIVIVAYILLFFLIGIEVWSLTSRADQYVYRLSQMSEEEAVESATEYANMYLTSETATMNPDEREEEIRRQVVRLMQGSQELSWLSLLYFETYEPQEEATKKYRVILAGVIMALAITWEILKGREEEPHGI